MKLLYRSVIIIVGLIILFQISNQITDKGIVPPLSVYMASTTEGLSASSTNIYISNKSSLLISETMFPDSMKETSDAIWVDKNIIYVEIATTTEKHTLGLSNHKGLYKNQGMLFVFKQPIEKGFWMKDMNFAIDIIWIDKDGKVISVAKKATPDSYPTVFAPPSPVKYVLEVNAGLSDQWSIKNGSVVRF